MVSTGEFKLPRNLNILKNNYKVFYYAEKNYFILYIAKKKILDINLIKNINYYEEKYNKILGIILCHLDEEREFNIKILSVNNNYKRIGLGYYLIFIIGYMAKKLKIKIINLDDTSNIKNYYENIGCIYDELGSSEMTCETSNINNKLNMFLRKYSSSIYSEYYKINKFKK